MNGPKSGFEKLVEKVRADFRFQYVGGGYFRDNTVPQGTNADIVHGNEILAEFCAELMREYLATETPAVEPPRGQGA